MSTLISNVKYQIGQVIKKFKFEELESAVLPIFPELSWNKIKRKLVDNHENFTTQHAIRIIEKFINKANISNDVLKERLSILEVIDVSRHYKRKQWCVYELKNFETSEILTIEEIPKKIKSSLKAFQMEMDVYIVEHNGIVFMSVKEKLKRKQTKTIQTTFFSLLMNETFFFCSKKVIFKNILLAVSDGLGYKTCKQIKLSGRDIPSLIEMLLTRKLAMQEGQLIKRPLQFKRSFPIMTSLGLDFTQHKQRLEYADKCFGDKKPVFEFLRVKCIDQEWKHKDALAKLPNEKIYTGVEFRSNNTIEFIKLLITHNIMTVPIPCYAANLLNLARNDITIKEI